MRQELEQFEHLSRQQKAIAIDHLAPGITSERIQSLEEQYGLRLSQDAKTVWQWHNGLVSQERRWINRFWGLGYDFFDLESSILDAKMRLDIRNNGDEDQRLGSTWLTLGEGTIAVVIDLTDPDLPDSPVLLADPVSAIDEYPVVSVAERIRWWNWSIEHGVNYIGDDGQWLTNLEEYQKSPQRHLM